MYSFYGRKQCLRIIKYCRTQCSLSISGLYATQIPLFLFAPEIPTGSFLVQRLYKWFITERALSCLESIKHRAALQHLVSTAFTTSRSQACTSNLKKNQTKPVVLKLNQMAVVVRPGFFRLCGCLRLFTMIMSNLGRHEQWLVLDTSYLG